jgi:hypothetical protein
VLTVNFWPLCGVPSCRNKECLSLGCDEVPLFWGRSPVDMYRWGVLQVAEGQAAVL